MYNLIKRETRKAADYAPIKQPAVSFSILYPRPFPTRLPAAMSLILHYIKLIIYLARLYTFLIRPLSAGTENTGD